MKYKYFKKYALGKQCRACINREYGVQLIQKDCLYWLYPAECKCCGQIRHIVMGITPMSRWKIWLKKREIVNES